MKSGLYSIHVSGMVQDKYLDIANFKSNSNEGFNSESLNKHGVLKKLFLFKNQCVQTCLLHQ